MKKILMFSELKLLRPVIAIPELYFLKIWRQALSETMRMMDTLSLSGLKRLISFAQAQAANDQSARSRTSLDPSP